MSKGRFILHCSAWCGGLLKASWGTSENNRRAKFYELTPAGRKRLREETAGWNRLAEAIASALAAQPEEI